MAERIIPAGGSASNDNKPFARDDAAWFDAHPERQHHIRPAAEGEWPPLRRAPRGYRRWTIVRQAASGFRIRVPVWVQGQPVESEEAVRSLAEIVTGFRQVSRAGGRA